MKVSIYFSGRVEAGGNSVEECEANAATDLDWMGVFDVEIKQTEIIDHEDE